MTTPELSTPSSTYGATSYLSIIKGLINLLNTHYVFPDKAKEIETALQQRIEQNEYAAFDSPASFCEIVTGQVQEVCKDKHVRVRYNAEARPPRDANWQFTQEEFEELRLIGSLENFGIERVERLPGNIGYLDLRQFYHPLVGGETAVAAMNVLANTSALLVDMRKCVGGSPQMVALITTYLFDESDETIHLNSFYARLEDKMLQSWTLPYVPGKRFGTKKPLYVLTSSRTFSGAEEFSYNLKNLKRTTLVGEVTGGGAHPGGWVGIDEHFEIFVPGGRAINPISGTNWEGSGVTPDVEVAKEQAFEVAYKLALKAILAETGDNPSGPYKKQAEEAQAKLDELEKESG